MNEGRHHLGHISMAPLPYSHYGPLGSPSSIFHYKGGASPLPYEYDDGEDNGGDEETMRSPDLEVKDTIEEDEQANHASITDAIRPNPNPKPVTNPNLNVDWVGGLGRAAEVRYGECRKNHAVSIGGHAIDGCGEFMPGGAGSGGNNTLICSACGCHRNFHRRNSDKETHCDYHAGKRRKHHHVYHYHHHGHTGAPYSNIISYNSPNNFPNNHPNISPNNCPNAYPDAYPNNSPDDIPHVDDSGYDCLRKRFRTKFSSKQKECMSEFAEKVGWRIRKSDEPLVGAFCAKVGVERSTLKVWMHNNKHTLGKKRCNLDDRSREWAEMEAPSTYSDNYQLQRTFSGGVHEEGNILTKINTDRVNSANNKGSDFSPCGDKSWDECHLFDVHLVGPNASSSHLESEQHSST